ncbi:hypothetical protein PMAYCL1PPCAC_10189, partial [Pristionchus mayeri]
CRRWNDLFSQHLAVKSHLPSIKFFSLRIEKIFSLLKLHLIIPQNRKYFGVESKRSRHIAIKSRPHEVVIECDWYRDANCKECLIHLMKRLFLRCSYVEKVEIDIERLEIISRISSKTILKELKISNTCLIAVNKKYILQLTRRVDDLILVLDATQFYFSESDRAFISQAMR